jgi:CHAD domain-containing protein
MARARAVGDLECDAPFALAAARVVSVRGAELIEHSSRVLDVEDVERLHDMRVASRRLRAALEIFAPCFPAKPLRATLKEVKAIADALGERRDRDVAIGSLEEFAAQVGSADRIGVAALVETLRAEQRRANEDLAGYVTAARLEALEQRLQQLVERAADRSPVPEPVG